jgi:hypothetical protein
MDLKFLQEQAARGGQIAINFPKKLDAGFAAGVEGRDQGTGNREQGSGTRDREQKTKAESVAMPRMTTFWVSR